METPARLGANTHWTTPASSLCPVTRPSHFAPGAIQFVAHSIRAVINGKASLRVKRVAGLLPSADMFMQVTYDQGCLRSTRSKNSISHFISEPNTSIHYVQVVPVKSRGRKPRQAEDEVFQFGTATTFWYLQVDSES